MSANPNLGNDIWDDDCKNNTEGITWHQACFNLVIVVIGAGVMALPMVPMSGGMLPSIVALCICGACITESGISMWRGFMAANSEPSRAGKGMQLKSYGDFGRAALGGAGELIVLIMVVFYFIGVVAGFLVLISEAVSHLSRDLLTTQQAMLWGSPIFALIALVPSVTVVSRISFIACISVFVLCGIMVVKSIMDATHWSVWPDLDESQLHKRWPTSFMALGTVVANFFGAFGVNGNVPAVLAEMNNPLEFPFAFKTSMCIVGTIYLAVMCGGYYGYGEFMQRDILDSLTSFPANQNEAFSTPFEDWTGPKARFLEDLLSSLLFIKLIIALPLNLLVIFQSFQTYSHTKDLFEIWTIPNLLLRLGVVVLATVIALCIPDFGNLFGLVCSIFGPCLQCFFPIYFTYKIRSGLGVYSNYFYKAMHVVITILALFTLTVGFYQSVLNVMPEQKHVVVNPYLPLSSMSAALSAPVSAPTPLASITALLERRAALYSELATIQSATGIA